MRDKPEANPTNILHLLGGYAAHTHIDAFEAYTGGWGDLHEGPSH